MSGVNRQVWIGLAHVKECPGNDALEGALGAWVNALAWVQDASRYAVVVREALLELGFELLSTEDEEPLHQRQARSVVAPELLNAAEEVRITGEVRFGTFHSYEEKSD